ncbi:MAG: hypothetical protein PHX04_05870 [Bacilli bacterium]|nr:hypothetical protein [Bacilli bacterium]
MNILIPNFSINLKKQISELYSADTRKENLINLSKNNYNWLKEASIYELDKSINISKNILNKIFEYITEDKKINEKILKKIILESNNII